MHGEVDLLEQARHVWFPRFLGSGLDYHDVERTLARIARWEDWCAAWSATADEYAALAAEAEERGHRASAAGWWLAASLLYHFGQFVFFVDLDAKRRAHARLVHSYARAAALTDPPIEPVRVPSRFGDLPAYLHRAPAPGPTPVVVLVPGLDSTKEQLHPFARLFVARGVAALALEGPGQGEAHPLGPLPADYAPVLGAAVAWIAGRPDLRADRVGVLGTSFGGYLAVSGASAGPEVRAVVALAGPFDLSDLARWPALTRQSFRHVLHASSEEEALRRAAAFSLAERAPRLRAALLVAHGEEDRVVPVAHGDRLYRAARSASPVEFWRVPGAGHSLQNVQSRYRPRLVDWLVDRLA